MNIKYMVICVVLVVLSGCGQPKSEPGYAASHFFCEDAFAQITSGMTFDQVKDLVGPPLSRHRLTGEPIRVRWEYSSMREPSSRYLAFSVIFDEASGVVLETRRNIANVAPDPETGDFLLVGARPPARPQSIHAFDLPMVQGLPPELDDDECQYLIQVMASWCGSCGKERRQIRQLLQQSDSLRSVRLILLSIDDDEQALSDYLDREGIDLPVACVSETQLPWRFGQQGIPNYVFLSKCVAYPFDFAHYSGWTDEYLQDLTWFLETCRTQP